MCAMVHGSLRQSLINTLAINTDANKSLEKLFHKLFFYPEIKECSSHESG